MNLTPIYIEQRKAANRIKKAKESSEVNSNLRRFEGADITAMFGGLVVGTLQSIRIDRSPMELVGTFNARGYTGDRGE